MDRSNNKNKSLSRHEERQQALDFVFESMFRDDEMQDAFDDAFDARDTQVGEYAQLIISGVREKLEEIDSLIEKNLKS